jgi:hypothetical protein
MIVHVVIFKARDALPEGERRAFAIALERAAREIPTVRGIQIGHRRKHGAGYEREVPDTADYLAILAFDDLPGLHTYLSHPAHGELAARFRGALTSALIYDFEVGGLEMLETLVRSGDSDAAR